MCKCGLVLLKSLPEVVQVELAAAKAGGIPAPVLLGVEAVGVDQRREDQADEEFGGVRVMADPFLASQ